MLSRPTTEQILLECCQGLMTGVLPCLTDETAIVRVVMIETVLRNMAVRAAHEIAWMRAETASITAYAEDVSRAVPDPAHLAAARAALQEAPSESVELDDVVETYCLASRAFSAALAAAVVSGDRDLIARGEQLLEQRADTETEVMAGWSPTGR